MVKWSTSQTAEEGRDRMIPTDLPVLRLQQLTGLLHGHIQLLVSQDQFEAVWYGIYPHQRFSIDPEAHRKGVHSFLFEHQQGTGTLYVCGGSFLDAMAEQRAAGRLEGESCLLTEVEQKGLLTREQIMARDAPGECDAGAAEISAS